MFPKILTLIHSSYTSSSSSVAVPQSPPGRLRTNSRLPLAKRETIKSVYCRKRQRHRYRYILSFYTLKISLIHVKEKNHCSTLLHICREPGTERSERIPLLNDDRVETDRRDDGKSFQRFRRYIYKRCFHIICPWSRHSKLHF